MMKSQLKELRPKQKQGKSDALHALRAVVEGNPFIGLLARASDRLALLPVSAPEKFAEKCRAALGVKVEPVSIADSNFAGLFTALNSRGVVVSALASDAEVKRLKGLGLEASGLHGMLTAVGNNVLANDKAALVNPRMTAADARIVGDVLGVEVVKRCVAGFQTVGSAGIVTNRGIFIHGAAEEEELRELEGIFGVKGGAGTANMGVPFVGICMVANSNGFVAGEKTSGFELGRASDALGFD